MKPQILGGDSTFRRHAGACPWAYCKKKPRCGFFAVSLQQEPTFERPNGRHKSSVPMSSPCAPAKKSSFFGTRIFLSKPQAWHIIAARSAVHIISPCGAVSHARARSPFARWHSVLRSVFDGTLAEQSARGSLVQARTHSRLIITRQRVFSCGLMIYNTSC